MLSDGDLGRRQRRRSWAALAMEHVGHELGNDVGLLPETSSKSSQNRWQQWKQRGSSGGGGTRAARNGKTAFREKAKEYHPDQNQNNKEAAEEKFKEVLTSYEAIKLERKNKRN
ncbi:Chaperone protein [Nymphaea thermarum]|nr:Chaperone protein [Nymphaea thermarum]